MAIKPYKRKDSPYWWMRGTHQGVNLFKSTGILHANKIRPPARVEAFIQKAQDEIEGQVLHGKSYGATFGDAARSYLEQGGSPRFLERLIDAFGHLRLKEIDQAALNTAARTLYPNAQPETVNRQFFTPAHGRGELF